MTLFSKLALARRTLDRGEVELAGEIAVLALSEVDEHVFATADRIAEATERIHADDLAGADDILRQVEQDQNKRAKDDNRDVDREALQKDMKDTLEGKGVLETGPAGEMAVPKASVLNLAQWLVEHAGRVAGTNEAAARRIAAAAQTIVEVA